MSERAREVGSAAEDLESHQGRERKKRHEIEVFGGLYTHVEHLKRDLVVTRTYRSVLE